MPPALVSDRLTLRLLGPEHLDVVHALFSSDGHTIGDGPVHDRAATAAWLARRQQRFHEVGLAWYGLWDGNETFVGNCGVFTAARCGHEPEIGYEIALAHRRRGFATEAARAVTDAAHAAGHHRLWATVRPANLASVRTLRSIGYTFVRTAADLRGPLDHHQSRAPVGRSWAATADRGDTGAPRSPSCAR